MIKNMTGIRNPGKGAALASGPDNVPAVITDQSGTPQAPAAIKEGEIIFSVEAVIGAGNGDYDLGAKNLLALHNELKAAGTKMLAQGSLSEMGPPIA